MGIHQLPDVAGFAPAHPLKRTYGNPNSTARRKMARPMGIEPTFPGHRPGVLSQLNYGTLREAAQRVRTPRGCGSAPSAQHAVSPANIDGQKVLWLRNRRQASNLRLPNLRSVALSPLSYSAFGFVCWAIIHNERPIEIGVTNRIRTGTNAFTGRDAAVTS